MIVGLDDADRGDAAAAARRAGALSSYVLGTALTRYVLRLPPAAEAEPDDVVATMAPVLQGILDG
jgi:hypothetical protein